MDWCSDDIMDQEASKKARLEGYFAVVTKDHAAPHGPLIAAIAAASAAASAAAADGAAVGDDDMGEDDDAGGAGGAGGGGDDEAGGGGDDDAGGGGDDDSGGARDDDAGGTGGAAGGAAGGACGGCKEGTPMSVNDLEEEGVFARFMMGRLPEYSKGNPPCQGINDCVTLKNHHKCIAGGVEWRTCSWCCA